MSGPPLEVGPIEVFAAGPDNAEAVAPLAIGLASTIEEPTQLVQKDIFRPGKGNHQLRISNPHGNEVRILEFLTNPWIINAKE